MNKYAIDLKVFSKFYYAVFALVLVVMIGTSGYQWIEGWTFSDAFFMTVITISTVGYSEVKDLSEAGQWFTVFLIFTSIGTFAYTISAITSYVVGGFYINYLKNYRLNTEISKLKGHVILVGYGRVGNKAASELADHHQAFVVLENNKEKFDYITETKKYLALEGDATQDENLLKAGLKNAKALITTLPNDADNLYVVLSARELNKEIAIISRAAKKASIRKLKIAGANNVIMPDQVGGAHMASLVVSPDVLEFLDHISIQGGGDVNLEEVTFTDLPTDFQHQTLGALEVRNRIGVNIIGFKKANGEFVINPGPDTMITPNSKLFVLGNPGQIKLLNRILGIHHNP